MEFDPADESVDMRMEVPPCVHVDRVAKSQPSERSGQVRLARHLGMIDQDRDHGEVPFQRGFDLDPNEVSGIVDPPGNAGFPRPVASDHGE